jgi:hypothetical protein
MVLHSDNDIPDDVTPRPLDELFEQTEIHLLQRFN